MNSTGGCVKISFYDKILTPLFKFFENYEQIFEKTNKIQGLREKLTENSENSSKIKEIWADNQTYFSIFMRQT